MILCYGKNRNFQFKSKSRRKAASRSNQINVENTAGPACQFLSHEYRDLSEKVPQSFLSLPALPFVVLPVSEDTGNFIFCKACRSPASPLLSRDFLPPCRAKGYAVYLVWSIFPFVRPPLKQFFSRFLFSFFHNNLAALFTAASSLSFHCSLC